ncbi:hypothetical protein lerEdw1_015588 [Lerista edwardsae]|nr:hypothetical protein lerEdw1_015588 [Lerista edwardsae]
MQRHVGPRRYRAFCSALRGSMGGEKRPGGGDDDDDDDDGCGCGVKGGKKKPLKQPKKQMKEMDEVGMSRQVVRRTMTVMAEAAALQD